MAYSLVYPDGTRQPLSGRVAITRQDNDLQKPDSVQASSSSTIALSDDFDTHQRLAQPQVGTSLSAAPYAGLGCVLEAGGVEVLPGARLALDDYTPRAGYTGKLLAGNKAFYDLLLNADGSDKTLRQLDLAAFDHDWTLAAVALASTHGTWQQGYVYDLYDRGLGAPPAPAAGSSRLFEAGYWPTAYARVVWEAVFLGAGVQWRGELPAVFDTALLPASQPFGYSDLTRAAHQVVAGYAASAQPRRYDDVGDETVPFTAVLPTKLDTSLLLGVQAQWDPVAHEATITQLGYYTLQADQTVHLYSNNQLGSGEINAKLSVYVNGQLAGSADTLQGKGKMDAGLTALAERVLLKPGDRVTAHWQRDTIHNGLGGSGPSDYGWVFETEGRLSIELLAEFPAGGRVHLADWLPDMLQKDFVKGFIQVYGLTQTTDPYTAAVTFRRTAAVLDDPRRTGVDWSELRDGSQPAKRSWRLGDFASRNWFRWKEDDANPEYAHAQFDQTRAGQYWDADGAKLLAQAFGAGYLDNGAGDTSLPATKDVLTLPFAASPLGEAGLLLLPYWKPKPGTNYPADLSTIAAALADGTYTADEAQAARVKALVDDFDTQQPGPRLCYQLATTREALLEDDNGRQQLVSLRGSYFVDRSQAEDLDFTRSLLPRYYPHLAAALARPLVLRPYVRLSAAQVVAFDQLRLVWLSDEQAWFFVNKVDSWEEDQASTAVELIRL